MRKITTMFIAAAMACTLILGGCGAPKADTTASDDANKEEITESVTTQQAEEITEEVTQTSEARNDDLLSGIYTAQITIEDHGMITVEMDADKAPITVTNFVNLASDGFYDGLTFHRIIEGFMMQGGDPLGNGTGGADDTIQGEFAANGIANEQSHTRGAISMARAQDMNSASSQFFIVHEDSQFLDGQYAVFGYVTEGMDIVDEICGNTPVLDNNGSVAREDQPIIESIKIVME